MFRPKVGDVYNVGDSYFVITQVYLNRHIHVIHEDGTGNNIDWITAKKCLENEKICQSHETWEEGMLFLIKVTKNIRKCMKKNG